MFFNTFNFNVDYYVFTIFIHNIEKHFISFLINKNIDLITKIKILFNYNPSNDKGYLLTCNSLLLKEIVRKYVYFSTIKKPLNTFKTKKNMKISGSLQLTLKDIFFFLDFIKNNFYLAQKQIQFLFSQKKASIDKTIIISNLLEYTFFQYYYTRWFSLFPKIKLFFQLNICIKKNINLFYFFLSHFGIDILFFQI